MNRKQRPLIDRLLEKVVKLSNGCWFFCGAKNGAGYGTIGIGTKEEGKDFAHRVSYRLHKGPIPEGKVVCHSCDCKRCVNPGHLFLGTQLENMQDMKAKGRACSGSRWKNSKHPGSIVKGEKHGRSKLNELQVREIIALSKEGLNNTQIALRFSCSRKSVANIVSRKNWKHLEV